MIPALSAQLRAFALERIDAMASAPTMWASTREGFAMQLVVLLEVGGDDQAKELLHEVFEHEGSNVLDLDARLDESFAFKAVRAARARLGRTFGSNA